MSGIQSSPGDSARRSRRRLVVGLGGIALGLSAALFSINMASFADRIRRAAAERTPAVADGVVALTGGAERIADAALLVSEGRAPRLLISGVNQATTRAELARETPALSGLLECCVDLGYLAENTRGNAAETAEWSRRHGMRRVIVVTSDYHMPRALAEMKDAAPGAEIVPWAVPTARLQADDWWRDAEAVRLVAVEYVKYLRTLARQTVDGGGDHPTLLARRG
ncbi:MAG: YdcF family protein [Rhizobiales bacterium]|nr:YdcF family protein [Hyphomicrobiales bacterium]